MLIKLLLAAFFGLLTACRTYEILPKPITFDQERRQLTLDYLRDHYHLIQDEPLIEPVMIIIHWTSLEDLESAFKIYQDPQKPRFRNDDEHIPAQLNVSAHYLIDQQGVIYQLMPDSIMANHVVGLNYCAIGIKNIGGPGLPLTSSQLEANAFLVKSICKQYPIRYLIGNYEYPLFQEHALWKNSGRLPIEQKDDPGVSFMMELREELKKLKLSGAPDP